MAFTDQATLAQDSAFRDKVRVALVTAAVDVMGEAQGDQSDSEHGKRQALAYQVLLSGGSSHLDAFAWGVAANPAINASSVDNDIQFTVNSLFSDMSGVRSTD